MRKVMIILISLLTSFAIMSSGYGKWSQILNVEVDIQVEETSESAGDGWYGEDQSLIFIGGQGLLEEQGTSEGETDNTEIEQFNEEQLSEEESNEESNPVIDIVEPLEPVSTETNSTDEIQIEEISVETSNNQE